jgi:RHS repeat-associated protein
MDVIRGVLRVIVLMLVVGTVQAQTTYEGAPYYAENGIFNSLSAAETGGWALFQAAWPSQASCAHSVQLMPYYYYEWTGAGGTNEVAEVNTIGYPPCTGDVIIYASFYGYNPAKNTGDGGSCDGGEGSNGGGSGSGSGGNGASSGDQCIDQSGGVMQGDPINTATGNKYLQDDDYVGNNSWLTFRRFYNSTANVTSTAMGAQWRHSFDRSLAISATYITAFRPDGKQEAFTKTNGVWVTDPDIADQLVENDNAQGVATSYTLFVSALRHFETYDATAGLLQTVTDETGVGVTLTYSTTSTPATVAPSAGLLLNVTDPKGRQLNFTYNSSGQLYQVTLPDGGTLTYAYDSSGNLLSVQYPDGKTRQYVYNESALTDGTSLPNAMTGIVDEAGVRYENTTYNVGGLATSSSFAGSVGTTQITNNFNGNGTSTIQYPLGTSATMGYSTTSTGLVRVASLSQPCGAQCGMPWQTRTYDADGNPATAADFNGNVTATTYDSENLLTQKVEAQGRNSQRTTAIQWNTTLRLPLSRTVSDVNGNVVSSTQWDYNALGEILARCEIDPTNTAAAGYACSNTGSVPVGVRRWTYTYCTTVGSNCPLVGLMLTATGPRTDLTQTTTYTYYTTSSAVSCGTPGGACYQPGDLYQATDALGHTTTFVSYDADGRVTRTTDANGVNTDTTYTPRGWLASHTVGGETTTFTYTAYGYVASTTDPDGVTVTYGYDTAHRLNKITDAQGNYIQYTLDAAGDKTAEQVYDSTGTLHKSLARTFNNLGQVTTVVDGLNNTVFNASSSSSYDANGNLIQSADALGIQRKLGYDGLNRLISTIDDYEGTDSLTPNTTVSKTYDSLDRITQVTDPSNLNTTYQYDGLSDVTGQTSPDTGSTARTFDTAGDVLTSTDAKGIVATSAYDALNRRVSISYADTTQNVTYTYDEANSVTGCASSYPVGRLTRIIENTVTTVFCYDSRGNVIAKQQVTSAATDRTAYAYTAANRLSGITYPSGSLVSYTFDADGRITAINLTPKGGTAAAAVSSVTYEPFGPILSYTLGNGQAVTRSYDANYRLTDITSPTFNLHIARDAMGDIIALGNAAGADPATETYAYDPLYRLTTITEASGTVLESETYNPAGDRLSKTGSGLATGAYTYNSGTHQLTATGNEARSVDADGNTTAIAQASGTYGFGYSDRNRMTVAQLAGATVGTYTYNALGERIGKVATDTVRFDYDEAHHLIGEYGGYTRDYVWLGNTPVAVVDVGVTSISAPPTCFSCLPISGGPIGIPKLGSSSSGTTAVNYVYADGLGTPRVVANSAGTVIWQWAYQGNSFGETTPTSSGSYALNLRYPGQYFDSETGLNYNSNRDYDPSTGRYIESDPKGLAGGLNTYAYVGNNPLAVVDPLGLCPTCTELQQAAADLAGALEQLSQTSDLFALGSGLGTALAGAGEGVTFGADTPVTITFGSATAFFTTTSFVTGGAAATLKAFASGDATSLANFDFSQAEGLVAAAAASRIPGVGDFADTIGNLTEQAVGLAQQAQEVCQ